MDVEIENDCGNNGNKDNKIFFLTMRKQHFSRFANFDDLFKLVLLIGYLYVMPFIDFTFNLYCIILTLDNSVLYKF